MTCRFATWVRGPAPYVRGAHACISNFNCGAACARRGGGSGLVLMHSIIDITQSYERWMNLQYILKYIICVDYSVENKILFFLNSVFLK